MKKIKKVPAVPIPAVFSRRNPITGELTLPERLPVRTLDEIYANLDAAGAADFVVDRDETLPPPRFIANSVLVTHDKAFLQVKSLVNIVDWAIDL